MDKISGLNINTATPFFTRFSVPSEIKIRLLNYLEYLERNRVNDEILGCEYAPSAVWRNWLENTFIGFSSNQVLVRSGHNLPLSNKVMITSENNSGMKRDIWELLRAIKNTMKHHFTPEDPTSATKIAATFSSLYDSSEIDDELARVHPIPYFRYLETAKIAQEEIDTSSTVLEIGPGAGVSVLSRYQKGVKQQIVIDLPETICTAFLFISCINPRAKIALPNEDKEHADILFLTPLQADQIAPKSVDIVFNMNSFQEMELDIVNRFINLARCKLKKGGSLISNNQERSLYIDNNSLENWNTRDFSKVIHKESKLISLHHRHHKIPLNQLVCKWIAT